MTIAQSIEFFCAETGHTREAVLNDPGVRSQWAAWLSKDGIPTDPGTIKESMRLLAEAQNALPR